MDSTVPNTPRPAQVAHRRVSFWCMGFSEQESSAVIRGSDAISPAGIVPRIAVPVLPMSAHDNSHPSAPLLPDVAPDPGILRLRAVHRALADLRRGTPVLLQGGLLQGGPDQPDLVVLAADTTGARGVAELTALAAGPPVLLLAPVRAAALLRRPVPPDAPAVAVRTRLSPDAAVLRGMADPTADQLLADPPEPAPLPALAGAALALLKLARLLPAALVAPARPGAEAQAVRLGLLAVPAEDVLAHPDAASKGLVRVAEARVPLQDAPDARVVAFRAPDAGIEHLAILVGRPEDASPANAPPANAPPGNTLPGDAPPGNGTPAEGGREAPLCRVHSECFTGDLLGSLRCDCGPQLHMALQRMAAEGRGVLLYLAQEGRGIGLSGKLRAYMLQDRGLDTLDANRALGWNADERNFLIAATMLQELGIPRVRLLTNNPDKLAALAACGVEITGREPLVVPANGVDDHYLATKARRFGHLLD